MALYTVNAGNVALAADLNQIVNLLNGTTSGVDVVVGSRIQAQLTGATAQSGYIGGSSSGAPTSGTGRTGDMVIDYGTPAIWVKTAGGWATAGVQLDQTAGDVGPLAASAAGGAVGKAADVGHAHSWAALIAAALTWTQLQTFNGNINIPSYNGSSFQGTAYQAVVAFGNKARQLFVASTRNDSDAAAGDILFNAG